MAKKTKSALQVAARERALQKSADFHARHEKLVNLAAEYFLVLEEQEAIQEETARRIKEIQDQATADCTDVGRQSASVVKKMINTGEPKSALAQRLDLTTSALKKLLDSSGVDTQKTNDEPESAVTDATEVDNQERAGEQPAA